VCECRKRSTASPRRTICSNLHGARVCLRACVRAYVWHTYCVRESCTRKSETFAVTSSIGPGGLVGTGRTATSASISDGHSKHSCGRFARKFPFRRSAAGCTAKQRWAPLEGHHWREVLGAHKRVRGAEHPGTRAIWLGPSQSKANTSRLSGSRGAVLEGQRRRGGAGQCWVLEGTRTSPPNRDSRACANTVFMSSRPACPPGGPSPGADVGGVGPVPAQMWARWAQSRRRCGRGGPSRGLDVGAQSWSRCGRRTDA
jgi:hypothetical protein